MTSATSHTESASWDEAGRAITGLQSRGFAVDLDSYTRNGQLQCRAEFRDMRTAYYAVANSFPIAIMDAAQKVPAPLPDEQRTPCTFPDCGHRDVTECGK